MFRFEGANAQIDALIAGRTGSSIPGLLVLNYDNRLHFLGMPRTAQHREAFARYARAVFERWGNNVSGYELWNEWNLGAGSRGGTRATVEDYVLLLEAVRHAADEVGIKAPLIAGAVGNRDMVWIRRFVQLGGLRLADGLSVHPYNHTARDASAEEVVAWLDTLAEDLRRSNGGTKVPLYVTEIGWPTHVHGTDETTAALRLFKLFLLLHSRRYIAGVWWYDLLDDGSNPSNQEHRFGLMREDRSPKPAFHALAQFTRIATGRSVVRAVTGPKGTLVQLSNMAEQPNVIAWRDEQSVGARLGRAAGSVKRLPLDGHGISAAAAPLRTSSSMGLDKWPVLLNSPDPDSVMLE